MSWLKSKLLNWLVSDYIGSMRQIVLLVDKRNFPEHNDPTWNTQDYTRAVKTLELVGNIARFYTKK